MNILLAEDQPDHAYLLMEALGSLPLEVTVQHVPDGSAALAYLTRQAPFGQAAAPDLVLLDLKMPLLDGFGVLAARNADPGLKRIPVIVLTTSVESSDVERAYALGCNAYMVKPAQFERLVASMDLMLRYWATQVVLPVRLNACMAPRIGAQPTAVAAGRVSPAALQDNTTRA